MRPSRLTYAAYAPVPRGRIFFATLLLSLTATAQAQTDRFSVILPGGDTVRTRPGVVLTVPVRIEAETRRGLRATIAMDLPAGWRLVSTPAPVTVSAGATEVVVLLIAVPRRAAGGIARASVSVRPVDESGVQRREIVVDVERVRNLEVGFERPLRFAEAGDAIGYAAHVRNGGNDTIDVTFIAQSSQGFATFVSPPVLRLAPGISDVIGIGVTTTDQGDRTVQHTLKLIATPDDGSVAYATAVTDLIPRVETATPRRVELPLFATVRGVNEGNASGLQAEVVGAGSLREDRSDRFELLLRSPETQILSSLGRRDEYRARYAAPGWEVSAGDWNYSMTPLTEYGRYAFGAGARAEFGPVSLGGFANRHRHGEPRPQAGLWGRYAFSPRSAVGLNLMSRTGPSAHNIGTVLVDSDIPGQAHVQAEAGASSGSGTSDVAYAVRLNGNLPWLMYDLRTVDAGPEYGGYYRDIRFSSLSLNAFATRDLRFELTARHERRNLSDDTLRGGSPRSTFVQVGAGYTNALGISVRTSAMDDPVGMVPLRRREDIVQLRSTLVFPFGSVTGYADIGRLSDRTRTGTLPTRRFAATAGIIPAARQTYYVSVDFIQSPDLLTGTLVDRIAGTLTASYIISDRTQAEVRVFRSSGGGSLAPSYTLAEASVEHVFATAHRAAIRLRRSGFDATRPEVAVAAEYGLPLGIPLQTLRSNGIIEGRVLNAAGKGIAEVLVTAGQAAALTDGNGHFVLRDLAPGQQSVTVDRATVGIGMISTVPLPLQVTVVGGEVTAATLRFIRGASIEAGLRLFEADPSGPPDSVAVIERPVDGSIVVLFEITDGTETFRRISDSRGKALFTDLRPGEWKLTVIPQTLPEDARIELTSSTTTLSAGERGEATFDIRPKKKTLRILEEGGVLR